MLILLPPSEGKTAPRRGSPLRPERWDPALAPTRTRLLDALVDLCSGEPTEAAAALGLGPSQAREVAINARLRSAPTTRADRVYTGVLYESLDLPGLSGPARSRATRWLAITSALFGLVRAGEPIPAYRLAGGVSLPGLGSVAGQWRDVLDPVVRSAAGSGLVVDLRSTTYAGFWRPAPDLARRTTSIRVLHDDGGQRSIVSHFNKATKGRLVHDLLEDGAAPRTPAGLADHLSGLGWTVEPGAVDRLGVRHLDVILTSLTRA